MVQSSFFADGENYSTATVTSNDVVPPTTPSQAPSSFYPGGNIYDALQDSDIVIATIAAKEAQAAADAAASAASASNSNTSAINAASSASSAATSAAIAATAVQAAAGTVTPIVDGTAAVGTSTHWAHEDHVHPTDASRAPLASPALTGTPTSPTPAVNDSSTKISTTAFLQGQASSANPIVDGTAAPGTGTKWSREDHVHPTDTSRAPLASPAFTGTPTAPTPTGGDNSTKLATTAFVAGAVTGAGVSSIGGVTGAIAVGSDLQMVSSKLQSAQSDYAGMSNGQLVASASAGTLTVSVKTEAGVDPSAADPVFFYFRAHDSIGDFVRVAATAATSVVIGSTKTLGATSGFGLRVWIMAFNNGGTVQLAAMNCSDANGVFCPQEYIKATTAVPGNASKTFYSTSAIALNPWRFIGFVEYISLTTAGTWTTPDTVQLFGPGIKKPGDVIRTDQFTTQTSDTGSNVVAYVASAFSGTINPQSTANLVRAKFIGGAFPTGTNNCQIRIQRGTSWTGASSCSVVPLNAGGPAVSEGVDQPNTTGAATYTVFRRVNNTATSLQCPYCNAAGDTNVIILEELMG